MSSEIDRKHGSVFRSMVIGSAWAVGMRLSMRLIGMVSILVLARLLTPQDFGVVAMGTIAVGLIEVFAELGSATLLLRKGAITRVDCDTAWTVRILQGLLVAAVLVVGAPFVASYFSEPRVVPVLWVLAAASVIGGFENVGLVLVRRELDFARDFRIGVCQKFSVALITITLAFTLRNYWALVFAQFAGAVISVAISYAVHPYRPRLSLANFREYLAFSYSMVFINTGYFLRERIGAIAVGGGAGAAHLGAYNVANDLAMMAVRETVIPIWRGLFPTFAQLRDDPKRFLEAHEHLLACVAIVCLPLGLGTAAVAKDLVAVLLGPAWTECVPLMGWMAIAATAIGLNQGLNGNILIVSGREKASLGLMWFEVILLVPLVFVAGRTGGAQGVAIVCAMVMLISIPVTVEVLRRTIGFTWKRFAYAVWRPFFAAGTMFGFLQVLQLYGEWSSVIRLGVHVLAGGAVYIAMMVALWIAAGRPAGPEETAWRFVSQRWVTPRSVAP